MSTYDSTSDILVANVQCETQSGGKGTGNALCNRLMNKCTNEPGYPTLCYGSYSSSDKYTEYTSSHSYSNMLSFVKKHLGPAEEEEVPARKCTMDRREIEV